MSLSPGVLFFFLFILYFVVRAAVRDGQTSAHTPSWQEREDDRIYRARLRRDRRAARRASWDDPATEDLAWMGVIIGPFFVLFSVLMALSATRVYDLAPADVCSRTA